MVHNFISANYVVYFYLLDAAFNSLCMHVFQLGLTGLRWLAGWCVPIVRYICVLVWI